MQKRLTISLVCVIFIFPLFAQNKAAKLAGIMQIYRNYNMFDGAVLVAEKGEIIYKGAFGLANREWNIANRTDTKFMLGSVSKPLPDNNVTKFPDKDLVMLTTVNIYLVLNRKEDAIRFYKKTLQIYPGSEEAKDRLKELEGK